MNADGRRLGEKAAFVRRPRLEAPQLEQTVLDFVKKHGRITRREASELCNIGLVQARNFLKRLHSKGLLRLQGERRGAYYELASRDKSIKSKSSHPKLEHGREYARSSAATAKTKKSSQKLAKS